MILQFLTFDFGITLSVGVLIGFALTKLIEVSISRAQDNRKEFRSAYLKFAETFTPYLQQLEIGDATLNLLIVSEFPNHDLARRDFIRYLSGSRRKQFELKWQEYYAAYLPIKQLGPIGMAVAIAPPSYPLGERHPSPTDMINWEIDRRRELRSIIFDLLKIAEKTPWF